MSDASAKPLSVRLAKASWVAPLLVFLMSALLRSVSGGGGQAFRDGALLVVGSSFYLVGFLCGVAALFGLNRHGRKGILWPALIGSLLSGVLLLVVVSNFWSAFSRAKSPQAQIERAAASLAEGLPRLIDEETSLDAVTTGEGQLVYDYSLINYRSEEVDAAAFDDAMRPQLLDQLCEPMAEVWEAGFSVKSRYTAADGVVLSDIVITGEDCGGS